MRAGTRLMLSVCLLVGLGCGQKKSTEQLTGDLKSSREADRVAATRLLPGRKGEAAQVVPALIEALKDRDADVRWSAAIGLGSLGDQAKDAVPALQAALKDKDVRVREGAGKALTKIDPEKFPTPPKSTAAKGG